MQSQERVDVLIVGAGPVGLTLANMLGQRGVRTAVAEERATLIDYPRGVGLDDEALRTFQSIGLADRVLPHTVPNQIMRFVNHRRRLIAEIAPAVQPFGWPRRNGFVQPLVDAELVAGTERFPGVSVSWGHALVGFTQHADGVDVVLRKETGELVEMRASYVVGCDGGRSITRRLLDVTFDGTTSPTRWLVVDIANDPVGTPNIYVGADPLRPFVSVSIAHGIRRFEFMVKDGESTDEATTPEFLAARLGPFLPDPSAVEIMRSRVYTHHSRIAGVFRKGRVLLAGDAAHLMPVWQGQGYNSGIRDAMNLGWKLSAVVTGLAADGLLDTYDEERRAHALAMIKLSTAVGRVISPTNRLVAGVRDALLLAASRLPSLKRYVVEMRFKPMPRYDRGAVVHDPRSDRERSPVGTLFIQPTVALRDGRSVPLDEVLGTWFAVLAWNNSPLRVLGKQVADTWRAMGATLIDARPQPQLAWHGSDDPSVTVIGDVKGELKAWFDTHEESVLFLRPDRCVAAASVAQSVTLTSDRLVQALRLLPQDQPVAEVVA
ncbi:bifunctional 3-(3-hydroxy-phenyl)propionate/3-hydroxycinnamic acid hydroxylase [Amycolatopsis jejuensis]|uniref:bifunctional 3-(3-hydroxy-phenyl)propionate/3-hydroxycinnamic acid hydroxylase n=1 Tax=Amycolatopsis jejuensis TaxID=330084 RepID=UPI000526E041|nr:bifunctional 3-(3-hydroxy-phenyl)propionate/3-hydroxycinnamic acid hydroxylase [Amycolatopsis jejuensis]